MKKDDLSGIAPATPRALARRALSTANWLEDWIRRLEDEMKRQNISQANSGDHNMTFTLKRGDVRSLVREMDSIMAEIHRLKPK